MRSENRGSSFVHHSPSKHMIGLYSRPDRRQNPCKNPITIFLLRYFENKLITMWNPWRRYFPTFKAPLRWSLRPPPLSPPSASAMHACRNFGCRRQFHPEFKQTGQLVWKLSASTAPPCSYVRHACMHACVHVKLPKWDRRVMKHHRHRCKEPPTLAPTKNEETSLRSWEWMSRWWLCCWVFDSILELIRRWGRLGEGLSQSSIGTTITWTNFNSRGVRRSWKVWAWGRVWEA